LLCLIILTSGISLWTGYQLASGQASSLTAQTMSGGIYSGAPSTTIWKEGSTYYAKDAYGAVSFSSTTADELIQDVVDSLTSGTIYVKKGTYTITNQAGISLDGKSNINILGENGATFKQDYDGTPISLLSIDDCTNIEIKNIIFDQDRSTQTINEAFGLQWIMRVSGDTHSTNIRLYNLQFLNGLESGLVTGAVSGLIVKDCYFDNFGEHPLYLSGGAGDATGANNILVEGNTILNWGKYYRGYLKFQYTYNCTVQNNYLESNEDDLSFPATSTGAYGPVLIGCQNFFFVNNKLIGEGNAKQVSIFECDNSAGTNNNIFIDRYTAINHGGWVFEDANEVTNYYEVTNSYITELTAGALEPILVKNTKFIDSGYRRLAVNSQRIEDSTFIRDDKTDNFALIEIDAQSQQLKNLRFINYGYRIIDATSSTNGLISGCFFDRGCSSWGIQAGGTTLEIRDITWEKADSNTVTIYLAAGSAKIGKLTLVSGLTLSITSTYLIGAQSAIVPFVSGTAVAEEGWDIDAAGEIAYAFAQIPKDAVKVLAMRIYAYSVVTEADMMELDILVRGATDNEAYGTHTYSTAGVNSTSSNFAANDVIYWEITHANIQALTANDSIHIKVTGANAAEDNCATDARFRTVEFIYI